jgi:hypothetical protein
MQVPYVINPVLTGLSLGFTNAEMIADRILPRVPVGGVLYKYWRWDFGQFISVPDTLIGRKSMPNQVEFNATEIATSTFDYGLEDGVPVSDSERAPGNQPDPKRIATIGTTNLVLLAREARVAALVTNLANYSAANKATLSGTSQWSDYANSNPVDAIEVALDTTIMRPNKLVMGRAVYTRLRQHPKVLAAVFSTGGNVSATGGGVASKQAIADLLEVDEIIVGEGWINVGKKGQAVSMQRVWGKDCLAFYQNPVSLQAMSEMTATFGWTGQFQNREVQTYFDPRPGVKGMEYIKVVEQLNEVISAPELAFLWKNAVS